MSTSAFGSGLDVLPHPIKQPPSARVSQKPPSLDDLDAMELPSYGLTNSGNKDISITTPNDLEQSQSPTPRQDSAATIIPTLWHPPMNRYRVAACCLEYFANGLNDAAPGALIPYIESWYTIGYAVVSMIWISNAVGFILAAFTSDLICARLGRAKSLMLSEIFVIAAYAVIACPVPFPVVVVAYCAIGFGEALEIALNNVFLANLANATVVFGAAQGFYGVGGTIGPLMATALVSGGVHWSVFYAIAIGFRVVNFGVVGWSFWGYEKEGVSQFGNSLQQIASQQEEGETSKLGMMRRALGNRTTVIGALFIFAYQGAEVAEAGWVITYLIDYRDGDPKKVGYVTSGFWAGLTIGRFVLTHIATRVGEKPFVVVMTLGCLAFQFLVWFVPSIIGEAVAVAIIGLLIGPIYPGAQTVFTRLLPGKLQVFAIGFISSMGSSGGALVPFLTGLIAQAAGTFVLHPICIFCFVWMLVCWTFLPRLEKRRE